MSTSPIVSLLPNHPVAADTTGTAPSGSALPTSQSLNNMFLQLLVAQLQHQDPLNPLDPSQFVGQLAQFSELSTVTSIYQLLQQQISGSGSGSGSGSSGGSSGAIITSARTATPGGDNPAAPGAANPLNASPIPSLALPQAVSPGSPASILDKILGVL